VILLQEVGLEDDFIKSIVFSGLLDGTFYIDDMKLVAAKPSEPTSVETSEGMVLPATYALSQSHPNPFNPQTTITYDVAKDGTVRLHIYAITGQRIRTLVDGERSAGSYSVAWDSTDDVGQAVASGVYLVRMIAGDYRAVRKMLLMK